MMQAKALCKLLDHLHVLRSDFGIMCFSGFTKEHLLSTGTPWQRQLLARLDILVDGPYIESLHRSELWRGSSNQQIHFLSSRYREKWEHRVNEPGPGIEFEMDSASNLHWMGIPPSGFRQAFETAMARRGIALSRENSTTLIQAK